MEVVQEKTKGRFIEQQRMKKNAGKAYINRKKREIRPKNPPNQEVSCKCYFDCKKITYERKLQLFERFYAENYKTQGTYLMGLINLVKIKRRRHGNYETAADSKRQTSISYTLPDQDGNFVHVCRKTFMNVFDVTQKRLVVLIKKKKMGDTTFTDRRSNNKPSKFTENDRKLIHQHINSIPRDVSHYSRARSGKEYLSPDLNIHRLYKAFLTKTKESSVSYKFYRGVFKRDFPNLSFHRPRVDICHTCDRLNCEAKQTSSTGCSAKNQLELHHRKVQQCLEYMKDQTTNSQLPGSDKCCISFDLQQVLFVPTLTHSDMFYLSQLSCYNLGIHLSDSNHAFMCMWHEGVSGRGGNEVASTLLKLLNSGVTQKKNICYCGVTTVRDKTRTEW